jgi:two-component system, OmpR family, response regulator BaeR
MIGGCHAERVTILAVGDDPAVAAAVAGILEGEGGYLVEHAARGRAALARLLHAPPDLLLLDLGLPDIDGMEVCRLARQHAPDLPIVILTARTDTGNLVAGLDRGADDYIGKPVDAAVLLARIEAVLRGRTAGAERPPDA